MVVNKCLEKDIYLIYSDGLEYVKRVLNGLFTQILKLIYNSNTYHLSQFI